MASLRVFIALLVPKDFSLQLESQTLTIRQYLQGLELHWLRKENHHFTLAFLGETEMNKIEALKILIDELAENHQVISLQINAIDFFPNREKVKVIAALPAANKHFDALYEDTVSGLQDYDCFFEDRAFRPHLTLTRIKQRQLKLIDLNWLGSESQALSLKHRFSTIALMKSETTEQGMCYTSLYSRELCGNC